jgi:hypothetical protein
MALPFDILLDHILPGTRTWKTERTKVHTVQFPDASLRTFSRQTEALAAVREYATHGGHAVPPPITDPYMLEMITALKAML